MPRRLARLRSALRNLVRRQQVHREISDEVRSVHDLLVEEKVRAGVDPDRARREARMELGGLDQLQEEVRDARAGAGLESFWRDVRYGARLLRRSPGFTAVAALTLALGIGATTAIFSVVNAVLLEPLPFPNSDRLAFVQEAIPTLMAGAIPVSGPDVADFRRINGVFDDLGAYTNGDVDLTSGSTPARVPGARVSAALFHVLGVPPALGRTFTDAEDAPGHDVVVLGDALWRGAFGGDPAIVGRTVQIDRRPYTVVGVMPAGFEFPLRGLPYSRPAQLWTPLALRPQEADHRGDSFNFGVVARLKAGVTIGAADADMVRTAALVQKEEYPANAQADRAALTASATRLGDLVVGEARPTLWLLVGAVAVLLAIACANVANLLLARGFGRRLEMAVRGALGAGRRRLARQLLVESALVGLAGGAAGLLAAVAGVRAIVSAAPSALPRAAEIGIDARVLGFALVASLVCGLVFGVAPALTASGADLTSMLREGGRRASAGRRAERLRDAFVVAQIALALVLVTGAGLLVRSLAEARGTDPGFRAEGALTMSLSLPEAEYPKMADVDRFFDALLMRTAALPAVAAATESSDLPLGWNWTRVLTADGNRSPVGHSVPDDAHSLVSASYFETLGIPVIQGRSFTPVELAGRSNVVIVSAGLARRFWPDGRAVGRRLKWGDANSHQAWLTVVGVVADVKQGALDEPTTPHTYEPYKQACDGPRLWECTSRHLVIRTALDQDRAVAGVRGVLRQLDPEQPLSAIERLPDVVSASLAPRNFNTMLVALFAAAALVLAAVGVYGVMAYAVGQRTAEIGTRLALGASPRSIAGLVVGHAIRLALIGVGLGVAGAFVLTRALGTLLFEVRPTDPLSFGAAAAVLTLVAAGACYGPVRRAIRVSPLVAMGGRRLR